jgi:hypothetical protein
MPKHKFTPQPNPALGGPLDERRPYLHLECCRIQFTIIFRVYCSTSGRLSAFFTGGLRYRDVGLTLQRVSSGGWRLIYDIDQRWVKNNRDLENIVFGTAGREHDLFVYDDTAFLLAMAMADKAHSGYEPLAGLQEQAISAGQDFV